MSDSDDDCYGPYYPTNQVIGYHLPAEKCTDVTRGEFEALKTEVAELRKAMEELVRQKQLARNRK